MRSFGRFAAAAALGLGLAFAAPAPREAAAQVVYTINGVAADAPTTLQLLAIGLPPGHYWVRANGDWGAVGSDVAWGNLQASEGGGSFAYRNPGVFGGSGERYGDGSWSHYNPLVGGGGVGGTADGCVYAYGWSNC